jgi:hypothetical protein
MTTTKPRGKRFCFYIPVGQFDEHGYIPSVVTEDEPRHQPLKGNGTHSAPWHWGRTYDGARRICEEENARIGVTPQDAIEIVASSMRARKLGSALTP